MSTSEPALFRAFPALRGRLPRYSLTELPTPITRLALPELGGAALYVKRDDRSCPVYGGNKPRKLEFLIGRALQLGCRRLVTSGGLGTHHGLATTILGRVAGLETSLVLVYQPITDDVRRSLELCAAWGAELIYGRNLAGGVLQSARVLVASSLRGERPYLIWTGGSTVWGNLGLVGAGLELAEQVRAGELPEPSEIWLAVGSGGTMAGLVLGLRLAGLDARVRGVVVTDIMPPSASGLARQARATLRLLRRTDASIPAVELGPGDFELDTSQIGPGYGAASEDGESARAIAAQQDLRLDPTYTAKCLAALRARARRGGLSEGPVLFWNTFNSREVASCAPAEPVRASLSPRLRRLVGSVASTAVAQKSAAPRSRHQNAASDPIA